MADIYKEAARLSLRFTTPKGALSVEQIWNLGSTDLKTSVRAARKALKVTEDEDDLSFLETETKVNKEDKLRFDILKDVYMTLRAEKDEASNKAEMKRRDQEILAIIASKKDEQLKGKSIEELEAMLSIK
jgi:hypothetical protein